MIFCDAKKKKKMKNEKNKLFGNFEEGRHCEEIK
jgi:hypothetical protein